MSTTILKLYEIIDNRKIDCINISENKKMMFAAHTVFKLIHFRFFGEDIFKGNKDFTGPPQHLLYYVNNLN